MSNSELYFVLRTLKSILKSPDKDYALRESTAVVDDVIQEIETKRKPQKSKADKSEED